MTTPRFNTDLVGKPSIDYSRYIIVYRDHPEEPWQTYKAYFVSNDPEQQKQAGEQALKDCETFLKERKNKTLEAHVIFTKTVEVLK